MKIKSWLAAAWLALLPLACAFAAGTELTVGVIYSATGPVAAAGIAQQRTLSILPKTMGGLPVRYIGLDDGGDTTATVKAARKLIADEHIDVLLGPSSSANSLAIVSLMAQQEVPMISLGGSASIVEPVDGPKKWAFKTPQSETLMASIVAQHMAQSGIKTLGIIAYNDAFGEGWLKEIGRLSEQKGIKIVSVERFERTDSNTTGQVLKTLAASPQAVFIAAAGTPAALPQAGLVERGFRGRVYQTHGVANAEFLKIGGKNIEGTYVPLAPLLVAEELPASHPARKPSLEFAGKFEAIPGAGPRSPFAAYLWDAALILERAVTPALAHGKPGSAEFRRALRAAIESVKDLPATNGVYTMSPSDHNGLDERGRVMTQIRNGKWTLAN